MSDTTQADPIFRPVMVLMSGRMFGFLAAFFIPVVLARLFDQSDFGSYKQLFLIHTTLFGLAQLGMAESLYYFLPMEKNRSGAYIVNALLLMGGAGAICALVLWWQSDAIALLLNNVELAQYIPLVGIYLLLILLGLLLEIVLTVRRQHVGASISYAGTDLLRAIFFVVPVLWVADLGWLMAGAVAFASIRLLATLIYLMRTNDIVLRTDLHHFKRHTAYALPFGLAGFIEVIQLNIHLYAVAYFFDVATFAIYAVGCLQVPLIDILMTSTSNVMMVNMRQKLVQQDYRAALEIWIDAVKKISMVLFPLVTLLILVAPALIVLLFGEAYRASVPVFIVWAASSVLVCLMTDGVLRVFAQNRFLILQNILKLAIIVLLIQSFLEGLHLIGAVLVTTMATMVIKIIAVARVRSLLNATWSEVLPWGSQAGTALICGLAALPCVLMINLWQLTGLLMLLGVSTVFTLSYILLLLWLGPLSGKEKGQLIAWASAPLLRHRTNQ
ncbi:MAG: lipopolysaccharide biosynthesis protein [Pseudohongiella sp.]|nr:lipopolysaccharide biosynthesis protein [Pseudohongiella sp.]MDO9518776.1 lipopolysaccharide biosynthesis protein [Pseudohongiella sp.]MDP2128927.1 lipopolysaccharide biosynthesis protein [Pseudohongiella sp.]